MKKFSWILAVLMATTLLLSACTVAPATAIRIRFPRRRQGLTAEQVVEARFLHRPARARTALQTDATLLGLRYGCRQAVRGRSQ